MTTSKINITIDRKGTQNPQLFEDISISLELHREKLLKIRQQISNTTGLGHTTFLLIEFPKMDFEDCLEILKKQNNDFYQFNHLKKDNRLYLLGEFKSAENKKFKENLQKAFEKLTELDNWAKFTLRLYHTKNIQKKEDLWRHVQLKGQAKIDNQFVKLFKEQLEKVSPKFIDSPLVILLQLLESLDLQLNLQSFQTASQYINEFIRKYLAINMEKNRQMLTRLKQTKQQMTVRLTLGRLFSLKLKGPCSTFAVLFQFAF